MGPLLRRRPATRACCCGRGVGASHPEKARGWPQPSVARIARRVWVVCPVRLGVAAVWTKASVAVSKLSVIEALGAEAGISVSVKVPGADAPWACMTDQNARVWNVSYTGSEGKL